MPNLDLDILQIMHGDTPVQKVMRGDIRVWPELPYDTEVKYLQSSGTQYIDTQVVLTKNYHIEMDVAFISGSSFPTALGAMTAPNYSVVLGTNNNGYPYTQVGGDSSYVYYTQNTNYYDGIMRHYVCEADGNRQYLSCNGTTVSAAISGTQPKLTLYLFARHRGDSGVGNYLTGKIGSVSITIDDILVREYIPVIKEEVGYLYDTVSGELFGNSGTGSFTYGNDITT